MTPREILAAMPIKNCTLHKSYIESEESDRSIMIGHHFILGEEGADEILAALAARGYQPMHAVKWPHTIEHEAVPTPAERGVF